MCASAIFVVGISGIPPILNYSSVKSYKLHEKWEEKQEQQRAEELWFEHQK